MIYFCYLYDTIRFDNLFVCFTSFSELKNFKMPDINVSRVEHIALENDLLTTLTKEIRCFWSHSNDALSKSTNCYCCGELLTSFNRRRLFGILVDSSSGKIF
jgi:hypothetical protein